MALGTAPEALPNRSGCDYGAAMNATASLSYCAQRVRETDIDRFFTALFAPAERRESLFALYAFNSEVARVAEAITEPMIGQIRQQWWRDRIDEIYCGAPPKGAEVAQALGRAVHAHGLSRALLDALIDAREHDLTAASPATVGDFTAYAEATSGGLNRLALQVLGVEEEAAQTAAKHVGIAWAFAGHLRAVAFHARHGKVFLPRDLLAVSAANELTEGRIAPEALVTAARAMAARAAAHLDEGRALRARVPRQALPALLLAPLTGAYLARLKRERFDPFSPRLDLSRPSRQLRLAWAAWRGRY